MKIFFVNIFLTSMFFLPVFALADSSGGTGGAVCYSSYAAAESNAPMLNETDRVFPISLKISDNGMRAIVFMTPTDGANSMTLLVIERKIKGKRNYCVGSDLAGAETVSVDKTHKNQNLYDLIVVGKNGPEHQKIRLCNKDYWYSEDHCK